MFKFLRTRKEMQSLIDASRKSLANAEDRVVERDKMIKCQLDQIRALQDKVNDLENNVDFLYNNLSAQKKKLVPKFEQHN